MNRSIPTLALGLLAPLLFAGCGTPESEASPVSPTYTPPSYVPKDAATPTPTQEPSAEGSVTDPSPVHHFRVAVADEVPLNVFAKHDMGCTINFAGRARAEFGVPVDVTVSNAAGKIVAATQMPRQGGEWLGYGCLMRIDVRVPESPFYEVIVSGGRASIYEVKTVKLKTNYVKSGTDDTLQLVPFYV